MVAVLISRESIEIGALAPVTAGVTRADAEVSTLAQQTTVGQALVSRVSIEVLGRAPAVASVTRADAEVSTLAQQTTVGRALVSRVSFEVGASVPRRASVTRADAEVSTLAQQATLGRALVSRVSIEAGASRGAAGAVESLALADGIEIFLHNWVDEAVLSTRYMTDVSTSPTSGAESRRGLMLKPERTLSLFWQIHACDEETRWRLDRLLFMLKKLTDERVAVPLYMDQRELAADYTALDDTISFNTTVGRFFPGARVVIVQLDWTGSYGSHTFHIIETVQDAQLTLDAPLGVAVPAGSLIIPMIDCEIILEAKAKYVTATNVSVKLELQEIAGESQLPPVKSDLPTQSQSFDDAPIFDYDPDWVDGIEKGRIRQGQKYRQGRTNRVYTAAARSREWHKLDLTGLRGCGARLLENIWRVIEFFDTRRGRLRSFWHIDQEQTWTIESIDAGGAFIGVEEINTLVDFEAELEGEWVGLVMNDGTMYVREAVTVQQVLTVFRITVDPLLPAGLDIADVARVARARRCRFLNDEIEERWKHTGYLGTTVEIIEVLEEKQVEI